jgi:PIN domain nuclease of toxin-antitoxin system
LIGYLLDTHALIWWFIDSPQLAGRAKEAMMANDAQVYASAASAYEIANKFRIGKLPHVKVLLDSYASYLAVQGFVELPLSADHARIAGLLPIPHRDPFDRMLIAQAQSERLILISNEKLFDACGVERLWD